MGAFEFGFDLPIRRALLLPLGLLLSIGLVYGLFQAACRLPSSSLLASLLAREP